MSCSAQRHLHDEVNAGRTGGARAGGLDNDKYRLPQTRCHGSPCRGGSRGSSCRTSRARSGLRSLIAASGDPAQIELTFRSWRRESSLAGLPRLSRRRTWWRWRSCYTRSAARPSLLEGKIVVDMMNYWPPVDGRQNCSEKHARRDRPASAHGVDGSQDAQSPGYHELDADRRPRGSPERRALGWRATIHRR